jgi:hypothetical protein
MGLGGLPALLGVDAAGVVSHMATKDHFHVEPSCEPNAFDRIWAAADLRAFGVPRSWQDVHDGLYPYSPERVVVIDEQPSGWVSQDFMASRLLHGFLADGSLSDETLRYIVRITHILTGYYGVGHYLDDWAVRLASREKLASVMGRFRRTGLVHQFQHRSPSQPVSTANGLVDWWLFLIPHGADLQSMDGLPTHVLAGIVEADPAVTVLHELACMGLVEGVFAGPYDWAAVSRMDRHSAALYLNRMVAEHI